MVTRKVSEPVQDALKAYFELALGLTEASKKKAEKAVKKVAKELVGKGNSTAAQLQGAVEDLVSTSAANRDAVTRLVRVEMDRALSRMGLATNDDVAALKSRVGALEKQVRDDRARASGKAETKPAAKTKAAEAKPTEAKPAAKKPAQANKTTTTPKRAVVKTAPVVKKSPTVKVAEVPVAPAKKAVKKAVKKATEATP